MIEVQNRKVKEMIMTALMMALVAVATMLFVFPLPAVSGYVHLGDSMIFLAVYILGQKRGAIAAGFGAAMADLILGFAYWAPFTFVIKAVMALIMGGLLAWFEKKHVNFMTAGILSTIAAGVWMVLAYFVVGGIMYGSFITAAVTTPMDALQFGVGFVIAQAVATGLRGATGNRFFHYRFSLKKEEKRSCTGENM